MPPAPGAKRISAHGDLCGEIEHYLPDGSPYLGKPSKAVEWLGDRSDLLDELTETLEKAGYDGDADDALGNLISDFSALEAAEKILSDSGHWTEGDFLDALAKLCERVPVEYDL